MKIQKTAMKIEVYGLKILKPYTLDNKLKTEKPKLILIKPSKPSKPSKRSNRHLALSLRNSKNIQEAQASFRQYKEIPFKLYKKKIIPKIKETANKALDKIQESESKAFNKIKTESKFINKEIIQAEVRSKKEILNTALALGNKIQESESKAFNKIKTESKFINKEIIQAEVRSKKEILNTALALGNKIIKSESKTFNKIQESESKTLDKLKKQKTFLQKTQTNFVNKFLENIEKYIYKIVKDILSKISIDGGGGGSLISNPSDTDGLPEGGAVGQILTIISLEPRVLAWSDAPALMQTPNWWSLFTQSKISFTIL